MQAKQSLRLNNNHKNRFATIFTPKPIHTVDVVRSKVVILILSVG